MLWLWKEPCVIRPLRRNLQHTVISKSNKQPFRPLEIVPKMRYESSWAVFWSLNYTWFQTKTAPKPYPLGRHIPICVIWGSTALPLPRDCFHSGTRGDYLFSLILISQSERHFARLMRMNFMIYNRNFAQQTRQRVIWKTLKYPHGKEDRVQTHPKKWANNMSTRARFLKGRLVLIQD